MGYASYLVWKEGGGSLPLTLYGIQLVMNLAWSPLFFKKHEIGFALLDITGTPPPPPPPPPGVITLTILSGLSSVVCLISAWVVINGAGGEERGGGGDDYKGHPGVQLPPWHSQES